MDMGGYFKGHGVPPHHHHHMQTEIASLTTSGFKLPTHQLDQNLGYAPGARKKQRKRTIFTSSQVDLLESLFNAIQYPDFLMCEEVAMKISLPVSRVSLWFKNHRAKCKRQKQTEQNQQKQQTQHPVSAPVIKKELLQLPSDNAALPIIQNSYWANNISVPQTAGNLTPFGLNTSSIMTTPFPPDTPGGDVLNNSIVSYQQDNIAPYNAFSWNPNASNVTPHAYWSQNYTPSNYAPISMDNYLASQQNSAHHLQPATHQMPHANISHHTAAMSSGFNPQMTYATPMTAMSTHHQSYGTRHPEYSLEYMGADKYQMPV